jgi:putative hydrolase of the HAD superfamily
VSKSYLAEILQKSALQPVRAVVFDLGGTLEETYYDDALRTAATRGLQQLLVERNLDPRLPLPELQATILAGIRAYSAWREATEIELPPERVWTEYVFPAAGLPKERLMAAAEDLTFYYETQFQTRTLRPEAPAMLQVLIARGYRLAVISNIISRRLVAAKLAEYGIARYFDPILTSSNFGWRKPNKRIFLECASRLGLPPGECAYVGDTVSRDVIGARRAGYGLAIQIKSFLTTKADRATDVEPPDAIIEDLRELVGLMERYESGVSSERTAITDS